MKYRWIYSLAFTTALLFPALANAHFLWLLSESASDKPTRSVHLYFAEAAEPDDPDLLDRVKKPAIWQMTVAGKVTPLKSKKGEDSIVASVAGDKNQSVAFGLSHVYGVISRGQSTFLLKYYAKTFSSSDAAEWGRFDSSRQLALDVTPQWNNGKLQLTVRWQGKPLAGAEVKVGDGISEDLEAATSDKGVASFSLPKPGLYSIRAKHVEATAGKLEDKEYADVRHYSTVSLRIPGPASTKTSAEKTTSAKVYPDFPQPVTSFGAAITGDYLYTYGGHTGRAHSYSNKGQSNVLRRLNLKSPEKWETAATGPRLQGLALVAHNGKLYRVGGFTAKNKEGEDHNLQSQATVSRFDPETKKWTDIAPLPEPRSSHDAAVVGDHLYVVGGWQLNGESSSEWHKTAWAMDLTADTPTWSALPNPPFQRRALALAAHQGKLYVIGGMQKKGGPATRVDVYDPAEQKWSQGPNIEGKGFDGFACSAFAANGSLYVSTVGGNLQQLSEDGKSWKTVQKLERARFFHRMLPLGKNQLLFVGGANMSIGKFSEIDVVTVD